MAVPRDGSREDKTHKFDYDLNIRKMLGFINWQFLLLKKEKFLDRLPFCNPWLC